MPITPTYPGVYIEEIPSGVRTIAGVATSIAAFIDYFKQGPMDKAVQVLDLGDFVRVFGGLDPDSEASYAIQQFFLNGGTEAWVVRTASGNFAQASVNLLNGIGGSPVLTVKAIDPGEWGNNLRVSIDYNSSDSTNLFNLTVAEYKSRNGISEVARSEVFRNLSLTNVAQVINDPDSGSKLIEVEVPSGSSGLPVQNGTVSGDLSAFPTLTAATPAINVTIGTEGTYTATFKSKPTTLEEASSVLEAAIRASKPDQKAFSGAKVEIFDNKLRILAGPTEADATVSFSAGGTDPTVTELKLDSGSTTAVTGILSGVLSPFPTLTESSPQVNVTIDGDGPHSITLTPQPMNLADAATALENAIRAAQPSNSAFSNARVATHEGRLVVSAGTSGAAVAFAAVVTDTTTVAELKLDSGSVQAFEGVLSGDLATFPSLTSGSPAVNLTIGSEGPHFATLSPPYTNLNQAATALETAIRNANNSLVFTSAGVTTYSNRLMVIVTSTGNLVTFSAAPADSTTVAQLKLDSTGGVQANLQEYTLGLTTTISGTAQGTGVQGNNGSPPDATALIGDYNAKTGIYALRDVDLFNLLCIPRTAHVDTTKSHPLSDSAAQAVMTVAETYCQERRAFFLMDTPNTIDEPQEIRNWLKNRDPLRTSYAALYFPRVMIPDPLNNFRLRSVGASGTVAGLYARIDSDRGVWKAPAGTEASLRNVIKLEDVVTDAENGSLNPLAINCLRNFPVYGSVCWGARTLDGADQLTSEYKYVPVRRTALFIEESLYRGLKWVVFEPNDEPLWAQIRLNVGAFMNNLFRQGAFQGKTSREAYLVKCDKETTTQNDINLGIVNILVGFAPLKPAEFVIIKIQQLAGQIAT